MITPNQLAKVIVETITGDKTHRARVININSKSLSSKGDLSFQLGLEYWRGYVDTKSDRFRNSKTILDYFVQRCLSYQDSSLSDIHILEMLKKHIIEKLALIYNTDILNLQFTMDISDGFVLINFKRSIISSFTIKTVIEQDFQYGRKQDCKKRFKLKVEFDNESEITNMRLKLLEKVSINLLKSQGYNVQGEECANNYVYTIKSKGKVEDDYDKCICGAVLNINKKKERALTQDNYLQRKIEKVEELNAQKYSDMYIDKNNIETDVQKIANASITYELLSTKHATPVIIENSDVLDRSIKEASFILYNNVRITAILEKYAKLVLENEFPQIIPIEEMESFNKIVDEESWSLIYNYIIKYPDVLNTAVSIEPKLEINIKLLWSFISNLCHDFSKYYRKNRILMRGVDSNSEIINIATERLHMLRALRIILRNSLSLLEIKEVTCM